MPRCRAARAGSLAGRCLALLALAVLPAAAMAEGMPQLDFANPLTTSQVVWGAIIFVVLYILLSRMRPAAGGAVLDERARHDRRRPGRRPRVQGAVPTRRRAKLTEATAQARAEAQAAINAALDEAKQEARGAVAVLNDRLETQLQEAESADRAARAAAMSALRAGGDRYRRRR